MGVLTSEDSCWISRSMSAFFVANQTMFFFQGQMNFAAPLRTSAPAQIQLPKAETNGEKTEAKMEEDRHVNVKRRETIEEKAEVPSDIAPPPPAFDNHSPMKEDTRKEELMEEKHNVEKEEEGGVHHATVATVTGDGESTSLESYGTCAVALYDYQVLMRLYT